MTTTPPSAAPPLPFTTCSYCGMKNSEAEMYMSQLDSQELWLKGYVCKVKTRDGQILTRLHNWQATIGGASSP